MAAKSKNKPTGRSNIGNQRRIAHTLALRPTHQSKCSDTSAVSGGKHPHTPHIDSPGSYGITATKTVASAAASHPASAHNSRRVACLEYPCSSNLTASAYETESPRRVGYVIGDSDTAISM